MTDLTSSRRESVESSSSFLGSTWLVSNLPAIQTAVRYARRAYAQNLAFDVLTTHEATELGAIAAQIFPGDETPGAREAGIVHFLDRALGTFASEARQGIRDGLTKLQANVREKHTSVAAFSQLDSRQQMELLEEIEEDEFFGAVRRLTVTGMFAVPSHGGNPTEVEWDHSGAYVPSR